MNARDLFEFLIELHNNSTACGWTWPELWKININIKDTNWEYHPALRVDEDLYDSETNSILTDIVINGFESITIDELDF